MQIYGICNNTCGTTREYTESVTWVLVTNIFKRENILLNLQKIVIFNPAHNIDEIYKQSIMKMHLIICWTIIHIITYTLIRRKGKMWNI